MAAQEGRLEVGRVGRPHGLDGSFHVTRPGSRLPRAGGSVFVDGERREVIRRAGTDERPIVRLEGTDSREAAAALRGARLQVDLAEVEPLGPDEYWAHELEGCRVRVGDRAVGTVANLLVLPSCEALEVRREDGSDLLVPLVRDAIARVDIAAREIVVNADFLGLENA
jgi:16S rRNA processing protein RimM